MKSPSGKRKVKVARTLRILQSIYSSQARSMASRAGGSAGVRWKYHGLVEN